MPEAEECFPRGRAPKLQSGVERKKKLEFDQPDKLFREAPKVIKEKPKGRKRKNEIEEAGWSKVEQNEIEDEESFKLKGIDFLQYKKIYDGMLILGCVKAVHELEVVVSLPNCQTGYVKAHRISSIYTELLQSQLDNENPNEDFSLDKMFQVGQLLVASVCDVKPDRKSIQLTLDPKVVNLNLVFSKMKPGMMLSGAIISVEDHGYTVDVGKKGVKAFMATNVSDANFKLSVGSVIRCTVLSVKSNGSIITLSNDPKKLNKMLAKPEHGITLDTIFPGTLVKFTPTKTLHEGTIGKFLDFEGSISVLNSQMISQQKFDDKAQQGDDMETNEVAQPKHKKKKRKGTENNRDENQTNTSFSADDKSIVACILYVTSGKHVALTTNPKVWRDEQRNEFIDLHQERYPVGHRCKVKVLKIIKGMCVLCQTDKNGPYGIIFQRNLSDQKSEAELVNLLNNKTIKARVIDNLQVDGVLELSARQSILEATFFRYQDIIPGALVQAKITEVNSKGFQVLLGSGEGKSFKSGGNLRGYVSRIHFSDIILQKPEKRFNEGDVITCRVLTVDGIRHHLHLTHKPTLVHTKLPVVTGYDQLHPGDIIHAFVISAKQVGCVVKMFNNVTGLVPRRELSADDVEFPEKTFFVGQVMKCRVISCEADAQRLLLSFCLKPKQHNVKDARKEKSDTGRIKVGEIVSVKVKDSVESGLEVEITEPVTTDNKKHFNLPTTHLSDFPTLANEIHSTLKQGSVVQECLVVSIKPKPVVSRKPLLVKYLRERLMRDEGNLTFSDLEPNMTLPAFIRHIADYGVFVEIGNGLVGLCPKSAMCDRFLPDTKDHYHVGQTVVAMVTNVDQEKRRFLVSLRPSECTLDSDTSLIGNYLQEVEYINNFKQEKDLRIGQVVPITLKADNTCTIDNNLFSAFECMLVTEQKENCDETSAVVIHVNMTSQEVIVTNISRIVECRKSPDEFVGSSLHCHVLHVNDDVAVGYSTTSGHLVCLPTKVHWNENSEPEGRLFKAKQKVQVSVHEIKDGIIFGSAKLQAGVGRRVRQDSELSDISMIEFSNGMGSLEVGMEIEGRVKSIRATCALVVITSLPLVKGRPLVGRLHASEIEKDPQDNSNPLSSIHVGETVKCHVIGCRDVRTHEFLVITRRNATRGVPELSMARKEAMTSSTSDVNLTEMFPVGREVVAYVKHFEKRRHCIRMEIIPGVQANLPRLLASEQPQTAAKAESKFRHGRALHCAVVRNDGKNITLARKGALVDRETKKDIQDIRMGSITNGEVRQIVSDGLLLHTELRTQGKVSITDLSDEYVEEPLKNFEVGQIVRCTVVGDGARDHLSLSLRKSAIHDMTSESPIDPDLDDLKSLKPKSLLRGYVKSSSKAGIFVTLSRLRHGRVTFNRASKYFLSNVDKVNEIFTPGKLVHCSVVSVSPHDGRVELSMLGADTGRDDVIPESLNLPLREVKKRKSSKGEDEIKTKKRKKEKKTPVTTKTRVEDLITKSAPVEHKVKIENTDDIQPQGVPDPGFVWDDDVTPKQESRDSDADDSGIEDGSKAAIKLTKKKIKEEKELEESETRRKEEELLDQSHAPNSATEWERLMVSNPQNSMLWVRYMAFHLHATEVDKARAVAAKALKTISFREEQEKLNVWVALLNLENLYGSDVTVDETLEGAMQHNDQLKVLQHLVDIYTKSGKVEKADEVYVKMSKKFRRNKEVWTSYVRYLMEGGRHEEAQDAFKRSLKALDKKQHLEMISKFAQLEYVLGDAERGRTMFENALSAFPKRTDIWSIYIDTLVKAKRIDDARSAFSRVTALTMSSKKMKSFFKRFVDFETRYGTESAAALVRQRALDYINSEMSRVMDD
uniref:Protein RRP5 homolog n=1 Tax=Phallusia mammillata TaxID=59560 RepID=A0A6F9DNG0_9ASCI|nr:protein RRP5 homolog [Phallusia mammillata]